MKKLYLFFCFVSLSVLTFGQTYLSENFSSNQMPPDGWTIDNQAGQWSINGGANAGGVAPEAMFTWINTTSYSRLISPEIDLTGLTTVSLLFNHFYDDYTGAGPVAGVATRSGGGEWNSVWEINPSSNVGPEQLAIEIDNGDVGASDFQLCFYIDGNLYNLDYWYVDDISLFLPYNTDMELSQVNVPAYIPFGDDFDLTGTVKNLGLDNITSFDVTYTIDGGSPNVYSVTGINLAFGETYNFMHDTPINLPEAGSYEIVTVIDNISSGDDQYPDNNSMTKYVGAVPFIPEKKVFAEEATGTWCGYCVRGTCYMDYMYETYPDTWLGVAVHNGDPMVNTAWDNAIPSIIPNFPGYPSATVDRSGSNFIDPTEFEDAYFDRIDAISPATIEIVNFTWDPVTREVAFDLKAHFIVDVYNELRFAAVFVEDSLWGTSSQWAQANYYSGGSLGAMCGYENLSNPIPAADMHYDHVAREILDTPYGTQGSLPGEILANNDYFYNYSYTLPASWNYNKMHFIGLLIDQTTGEVLNCNDEINYATGINPVSTAQTVKVYPNPSNGVVYVSGAENAKVTVLDATGAVVASFDHFNNGPIDLNGYEEGIYFLNIVIDNKTTINKKISLLR